MKKSVSGVYLRHALHFAYGIEILLPYFVISELKIKTAITLFNLRTNANTATLLEIIIRYWPPHFFF